MREHDVISGGAAERIERQLKELTEAVHRLVIIEERQAVQSQRIDKLEARISRQDDEIDDLRAVVARWVNRGMGMWGAVMLAWSMYMGLRGAL